MLGQHLIKSWSTTQVPISLSSGEAEFYGVVKASSVALGYQAMMEDLGLSLPVRVWTDSTATMGICGRRGLGKLRHIDTQCLWIQQKVRRRDIELRKIRGDLNPGDVLTKPKSASEMLGKLCEIFVYYDVVHPMTGLESCSGTWISKSRASCINILFEAVPFF